MIFLIMEKENLVQNNSKSRIGEEQAKINLIVD